VPFTLAGYFNVVPSVELSEPVLRESVQCEPVLRDLNLRSSFFLCLNHWIILRETFNLHVYGVCRRLLHFKIMKVERVRDV
jgi:hypothetical protein